MTRELGVGIVGSYRFFAAFFFPPFAFLAM